MQQFIRDLNERLGLIRESGLYRELRRIDSAQSPHVQYDGRELINFSSNDYLGLATHPALRAAAQEAVAQYGAGSGASRLICGSLGIHHRLEESLATFKGAEAALSFSSGYAAAVGTLTPLLEKDDVVILDKLVHASLVDAARLSGARLRVFDHNDLDQLADILRWVDGRHRPVSAGLPRTKSRTLIVTESVFSMDGDLSPLREIVELKDQHGAWLLLDEAHATGLFGENRRGLAESFGLGDRIEIQLGTLGKALGSAGGYICGPRPLIDFLINRARSFIFSTAPVPAASGAALAAVELVQSAEGENRRNTLWARVDEMKNALIGEGWCLPPVQSAILPLIVGGESRAVELATVLRERGLFIPAIRFPSVAKGRARLRVTVTASHTKEDIKQLRTALRSLPHESEAI